MPRSGPISLSLPSFSGATRGIIVANLAVFFALALMNWLTPGLAQVLLRHSLLRPLAVTHGEIWQLFTYSFINDGVLNIAFAMLTLWFIGYLLEEARGTRWLWELYAASAIGGGVIASAIAYTRVLGLRPEAVGSGAWGGISGLMIAVAMLFGDQEFYLWFVLRIKAKYMVAIFILVALALFLKESDTFGALLELAGALSGFLFTKFAPSRGMAFGASEQYFSVRNGYYRWKRRRAARKFEVYMRKQNRVVHFDNEGRYIDPDEERKSPKDRRWMN
ncbi:hypothetical protein GCM10011507_25590 [Edaphobacter acidisoli]|uniref:Peptidase S54 rhomboid domain-containing protein n=1 Tax=Edaphobacter acidisoli TaxID=2040573 RepID=A0A916RYU5_9BACT|nr:rhomboid family intramembrane serine protease [Edaphobacter acidisoli]GGA72881.1 hypothetical protein GCM10011507_25590 [Edaphobacter acidisoli]